MTLAEQIAKLVATRKEKSAHLNDISQKSMDEERSMNDAEAEEFDTVENEIKRLDDDLARLRRLQNLQDDDQTDDVKSAKPADGDAKKKSDQPFDGQRLSNQHVRNTEKLEPGVAFARFARCKLISQMDRAPIDSVAKTLYPGDSNLVTTVKAAVEAASTLDDAWAGNLINEGSSFADFVEYLRPRTIVGQVQDRLRRLPFDTPVLVQNSGGTAAWVKEGDAKPVTKWGYSRIKMAPLTVAAITAVTKQQLKRASLSADMLFRDELARAVGATIDSTFADPAVAAVTDESPGSIFNGVAAATGSGGGDVVAARCDIATLLNTFSDSNLQFDGLFWVMSGRNAIALSQMTNEIGNLAYPTVTPVGGTLAGYPVFVSNYAPTDSSGSFIALVKGSEIYYADDGGIDAAMSDQASLVMDSAPSMNSTTPTPAEMVSMFQTNSVAIRVERFLNWQRRRAESVAWMSVDWDACASS